MSIFVDSGLLGSWILRFLHFRVMGKLGRGLGEPVGNRGKLGAGVWVGAIPFENVINDNQIGR